MFHLACVYIIIFVLDKMWLWDYFTGALKFLGKYVSLRKDIYKKSISMEPMENLEIAS